MELVELLQEAIRRYPPGTKFKPAHITLNPPVYTIKDYNKGHYVSINNIQVNIEEKISWSACVYFEGKWAEIVWPIIINNYQIY